VSENLSHAIVRESNGILGASSILHGINIIVPKSGMLLQNDLSDDILTFLHLLLDPIFAVLQDEGMRRNILSTVVWSFLIICGLVFVVYEFPTIMNLLSGSSTTPIRRQLKTVTAGRAKAVTASATRHQISRDKTQKERERRAKVVKEAGVTVAANIEREGALLRMTIDINNGSTSKIDMVIVDLDIPAGIDVDVGSFRMQRLGSIHVGELKSANFLLRPMGGDPLDIGGHVEFLGASYEVSIIAIPVPEIIGEMNDE